MVLFPHSLQLRHGVSTSFPLVSSTLAFIHDVALDWCTAVIPGRFPEEEDALGSLVPPFKVLRWIRNSCNSNTGIDQTRLL